MSNTTDANFISAKRVLRYLRGTYNLGLVFKSGGDVKDIRAYTDADWGGDHDKRRRMSGMLMTINSSPVLWGSKMQSVVATSTAEAEYISAAMGVKEALWVRKLLGDIMSTVLRMPIYCDNKSALTLMMQKMAGVTGRSKHIDIQFHFIRNSTYARILMVFVPSKQQQADSFTKALSGPAFGQAIDYMAKGPTV
jgi:hypothetical protein